jgi:uncharacterized membrane protein YeaQ/YmgE (transglycosylase-associated protein family)
MDAAEIIALLVVGVLAGAAAASVMGSRWVRRRGLKAERWVYYAVVGIIGAVVGQLLLDALGIDMPDILSASITVADIAVAFIGAVIVIFVLSYLR